MTTAQVDKKCYKNQTAGWISVVKLNHLGGQEGTPVAPHATEWLTDEEAILTARAPQDPKDNPFVAKVFDFYDESGAIVQQEMTPLVMIEGERYSPSNERFVPQVAAMHPAAQEAAAQADTAAALAAEGRPVATSPSEVSGAPPQKVGVPVSHGVLGGSNARQAPPVEDAPAEGKPPQAPAPEAVVAEEHAAEMPTGEETGAAPMPEGQAPEGEYASHEEVGSPDAPTQEAS